MAELTRPYRFQLELGDGSMAEITGDVTPAEFRALERLRSSDSDGELEEDAETALRRIYREQPVDDSPVEDDGDEMTLCALTPLGPDENWVDPGCDDSWYSIDAEVEYCVEFGKGDASDYVEYECELTGAAAKAYRHAQMFHEDPNEDSAACDGLAQAEAELRDIAFDELLEAEDPYAMECAGQAEMDEDELIELVRDRDPHALEYFGLEDAEDEELEDWEPDELPQICEFYDDFQAENPFDGGYTLLVQFAEGNSCEGIDEDEAEETLEELFDESVWDYSEVRKYVTECGDIYDGDDTLEDVADRVAEELGITDWRLED